MTTKVVMVTGAARGFGAALVDGFASAGYRVAATARQTPANEARAEVSWASLDVSNAKSCQSVVDQFISQFRRIDVLINNASAYSAGTPLHELSPEAIAQELDVTLRGAVYVSRAYISRMQGLGPGAILFIGSTAGLSKEPGCGLASVYAAAKAGVIRFAEALQDETGPFGIRTQVVIPGNMSESDDEKILAAENSVSYAVAARAVIGMVSDIGNLRQTHVELRSSNPPPVPKDR